MCMQAVFDQIRAVADARSTVLIQGESGTGKELAARAAYDCSTKYRAKFVPVHCGTLSEHLLESELFGHERGAFTGAMARKEGLFRVAEGGTLFLDEIGDITTSLQLKLLRVLQEGEYRLVGGTEVLEADVRVLAATNRDLEQLTRQGKFREDLFYRLNVIAITMPPLRERREDIPLLANYFLVSSNKAYEKEMTSISSDAMNTLVKYDWPGNVRELQNVLDRAVAFAKGDEIRHEHLPEELQENGQASHAKREPMTGTLSQILKRTERLAITDALRATQGRKEEAARLLGINRSTLWK